jgi:hypothetical protein
MRKLVIGGLIAAALGMMSLEAVAGPLGGRDGRL